MRPVAIEAKNDGIRMRGYISTSFGCPYEGKISVKKLLKVMEDFFKLDIYEISIGDTTGVAIPTQVKEVIGEIKKHFSLEKVAMHFHDTRGMAVANILTSLDLGIRIFDSSAGGLGGCPYAKGATGNVATEDVWYLCESLGLKTGIDLAKLADASSFILNKVHKETPSKFLKAYQNTGKI